MKLEGRVAFITGASGGIGGAIARTYASEGANLALAARSVDKLEALADRNRGHGKKSARLPVRRHEGRGHPGFAAQDGRRARPGRHPREQRRHRELRGRSRASRRGVGTDHANQRQGALHGDSRSSALDARAQIGKDHQRSVGFRQNRPGLPKRLRGVETRRPGTHQSAFGRSRPVRHHGELHLPHLRLHRHVRGEHPEMGRRNGQDLRGTIGRASGTGCR